MRKGAPPPSPACLIGAKSAKPYCVAQQAPLQLFFIASIPKLFSMGTLLELNICIDLSQAKAKQATNCGT